MKKCILYFIALFFTISSYSQPVTQSLSKGETRNPLPSTSQMHWLSNPFYLFLHFGPNTFTGKEWGDGKEKKELFNPIDLDCEQWCKIAKSAGAKGLIITAKHHDGFCLWPSKLSTHTVREAGFKRDILAELSAACKKYGLLFGVYLSPWDRNHPDYGTEKYNDIYVGMMKEIFQNYGPIWELWWDGANGEGPNGKKQVYDWKRFESFVRTNSPQTVVFSDIGPDIRWVGNEQGLASETNWALLDTTGFKRGEGAPPTDTLQTGNYRGKQFMPAEVDVSIRKGWFFKETENETVKSADQIMDIYLKSVGRNANLLLNVPPTTRGKIHEKDSVALLDFATKREALLSKNILQKAIQNIAEPDKNNPTKKYSWYYILKEPATMRGLYLKEDLLYGQKIASLQITVSNKGESVFRKTITTVGNNRIILFPEPVQASEVAIVVLDSKGMPVMKEVRGF